MIGRFGGPVRPAATVQEFLADPVGHYIAGRSFVVWAQTESVLGSAYFGHLEPADFPLLGELFDLHRNPHLKPPFDALCDGGRLAALDRSAFELLGSYMMPRWSEIVARVRRLAIVRPSGLAGATLAGLFYETVRPDVRAGLFTDRQEALDCLGLRARAARVEVEQLLDALDAAPPLVRRLRAHLAEHHRASLASAARAPSLSTRSLQRRLQELGTSFREELERARVRAAEALLTDTDQKIESIAREVGCVSPSAFYELFRRHVGESPADFRRRRR
jgi:AraC-like DNA-binding protein